MTVWDWICWIACFLSGICWIVFIIKASKAVKSADIVIARDGEAFRDFGEPFVLHLPKGDYCRGEKIGQICEWLCFSQDGGVKCQLFRKPLVNSNSHYPAKSIVCSNITRWCQEANRD